jgi:hypothetical protein
VKEVRKATVSIFALALLVLSFAMPTAAGAGSITLTPAAQAPGGSVTVTGMGFGASRNIGVAFGAELNVTGEIVNQIVTGDMRDYNFTHRPIKPGSVQIVHLNLITGSAPLVTDDGAGTLYLGDSGNIFSNAMNYALGNYHRDGVSGTNPADYLLTASYTSYQYSLTSFGGITTDGSGTFSASFSVPPAAANGNYNVTAIGASGNVAVATLNVDNTIPEGLPLGAILLLSSAAVAAVSWCFRKRPRITY